MYSEEIGPSLGIAGLAILLLVAGLVIYEKMVANARSGRTLREKMDGFYKAAITKYVLMSLGCLVVGVGYYLTGHQILVATYMVTLIAYTVNRPTIHRLIRKLKLKREERDILKANEPIA
jgi:putative Mn2+ efflux pump MntP